MRNGELRKYSLHTGPTSIGVQPVIVGKRPWMMRSQTTTNTSPRFYTSTARGLRISQATVHNHRLKLTAAAIPVLRDITALSAAAAAELFRSATGGEGTWTRSNSS